MLGKALREGNEDQQLAAMDVYRIIPAKAVHVMKDIYALAKGQDGEIREAAFNTLWHLNAAGLDIPAYLD